jgi:hypothetical protein
MRGFRLRSALPLRPQLAVEQLEDRAQPALLMLAAAEHGLNVGLHLGIGSDHANHSAAVEVSLPATANPHAVVVLALHFGTPSTPTTPPVVTPPVVTPPVITPPVISPTDPDPVAPPASGGHGFSSLSAAANAAAQQSFTAAVIAAASGSFAALLPPSATVTAVSGGPSANPTDSRGAGASQEFGATPSSTAPVLYNFFTEAPSANASRFALNPTFAPGTDANPKVALAVVPAQASQPSRVSDAAEVVVPELVLPPIVVDAGAVIPAAEVAIPNAAPVAVEETATTWTWPVLGIVGAVSASWAVRRHWLKMKLGAARRPENWRDYLLGLDFDRA